MDSVALLTKARAAGLTVKPVGGRLVIRGPRRAEPVARRLIEAKAAVLAALPCDTPASKPEDGPMPDLTRILPPVAWLTPRQRRLWRERMAAYQASGMAPKLAEQEAMAELVMTGKLCDPGKAIPWPACTSPVPDVQARRQNI